MAVTGNIYSSYITNALCNLTGEVHFEMQNGASTDMDTLFAKNAFNSIPDGSTINKVSIIFDGALSRDDTSKYKGYIKISAVGCFPTWDGAYNGYSALPWSNLQTLWSGTFDTGKLTYHYATYTHVLSGITLAQLKSGLLIRATCKYDASGFLLLASDIYIRNFHVVVDYTEPPYTITYNGNGATSGSVASQSCHFGTDIALNGNSFAKSYVISFDKNYSGTSQTHAVSAAKFRGWEDHGTITASNGEVFTAEQFDAPFYANTYTDIYNAFKYNKQSLVNHYANNGRSEGRACIGSPRGVYPAGATVNSLAPNGGSVLLKAQWSAMPAITLATPERDGYTFLGWYTAAEGGTKVGNAGESYTPTRSITLYAHWINSAIKSIYLGNKRASLYLGLKQILRIFKGLTEIYYDPFAD